MVLISLLAPISLFGFTVSKGSIDANSIQVLLITLAISIVAFFLSQHLIDRFKDTLCSKGLFGKDLNKAGERETKEKV